MSYTPTTWHNGDTITVEKLNKMEQGIASGGSNVAAIRFILEDGMACSASYGLLTGEGPTSGTYAIKARYYTYTIYEEYNSVLMPLFDLEADGVQSVVFFDYLPSGINITCSGGVSSSYVEGYMPNGQGGWYSGMYPTFIVTGPGTITITSNN